ncbi:hypothetical protein FRC10_005280 [Ceratobasidium sp. 414]|nr:hypothetical protein FRC10_005280 [Ceratobasidium sp. 414]
MVDFEVALPRMRFTLDQLLAEWRVNLEKTLIERLPCDTRLTMEGSLAPMLGKETSATSDLHISELAIEVDSQPIRSLPLETQRLLRADVVWRHTNSFYPGPCFYTDSFQGIGSNWVDSIFFSARTSEIAKVLLATLGYPNVTYLEMKAAGPAFTCGRCCGRRGATWGEMLQHYFDKWKEWDDVQHYPSFWEGRLVHVFTHNPQGDKPLVRMANDEEKKTPSRDRYQTETDVMDHVHQVHLVQNPEKHVHYI